eukprot:GILI01024873.1.p1 GENE.GILI01024873.1~~GILI01024873.1.p1  ORF type:complete len:330 (-),score=33.04 GILI01024873.1:39-1028(-)
MASSETSSSPSSRSVPVSMVGSGSSVKEGLIGLACGVAYGLTTPLVGQPFDTVKTLMQSQPAFAQRGMVSSFSYVIKNDGFRGLYRGILPPLLGSSVFRSVQFGAYAFAYSSLGHSHPYFSSEIPGTSGLQPRVLLSGLFASACRAFIECPLELMKVRRQVGGTWRIGQAPLTTVEAWKELVSVRQVQELYKGFGVTFLRTWGLMGTFFILVDYSSRKLPDLLSTPIIGPFFKGGVCATAAWWVIWPFEFMKSQVQAAASSPTATQLTVAQRMQVVLKQHGFLGLYRGILPGSLRSLIGNGCSMIVFSYCQSLRHKYEQKQHESIKTKQ